MSSSEASKVRPFWWDPKSPASLLLPSLKDGQPAAVDFLLSHPGASCNPHELAALHKILQAHEDYCATVDERPYQSSKTFSQACREAVRDCLAGWQQEKQDDDDGNYDLLETMYSVMHLSDVFMPLLPSHFSLDYHEDPFDKPGAATADTVRYLRYNHMSDPENDPEIQEMLDSRQPEQFGDGTLYWNYVQTMVLRGCLEAAWEALRCHSLYVTSTAAQSSYAGDPYYVAKMQEIKEGFELIHELMMRAPLPGGRTDDYDDALEIPNWNDDIDATDYLLEGLDVDTADYKYWEASIPAPSGDYPIIYNPDAAVHKHKRWQEYVRECRLSFRLERRIPELGSILAILCGDFAGVEFDSWDEKFCAELLYRQPDIRPRNMSARARRIMTDMEHDKSGVVVQAILSIMDGNAGHAIQLMYILGGASGAALPATVTSLLYNLFIESNILPPDSSFRKTEFLCEAASAIQSSLAQTDPGVGTRLAIRLLIPYVLHQADREIVSMIANILDHRAPVSDAEARSLLNQVRPLVERKSMQVLDGCASIVLSRYRRYLDEQRPGGGIHWLIVGIELESLILKDAAKQQGSCYRTLVVACHIAAGHLLKSLAGDIHVDGLIHKAACEMVSSLEEEELFQSGNIREALELVRILKLFNAIVLDFDSSKAAEHILACMEEQKDQETNAMGTLAPHTMQWHLLRAAKTILDKEEDSGDLRQANTIQCAFNKRGITILMEQLTRITSLSFGESATTLPDERQVFEIRESLAKGLARAFVAENSQKAKALEIPEYDDRKIKQIRSVDLRDHKRSIQRKAVQCMLDP